MARKVEARLQDIEAIYNFYLGGEFEVAICALLEEILPAKYGVCRGFVVAKNGDKAGDDLIIYDKMSSPTLRSGMSRQFPVKERIPVDAVYAYIECKHSITDATVLEKAITQAQAVKKLILTRRGLSNPEYEANGPTYNGSARDSLKNQPFCAVFARHYSPDVAVHNVRGEHTPDLLILGSNHIATHTMNMGADGIHSALFYDTKFRSPLCVESAGLVSLLQALSWIQLVPIDWLEVLNATFLDNLLNRKSAPEG